jgi:hypothetical protein
MPLPRPYLFVFINLGSSHPGYYFSYTPLLFFYFFFPIRLDLSHAFLVDREEGQSCALPG